MRRLALVLQDRVERHGEEAAGDGEADEIGEHAPVARLREERRRTVASALSPAAAAREVRSMAQTAMTSAETGT